MASSTTGSFNTNDYSGRYVTFSWNIKSQSPETNETKINWSLTGAGVSSVSYHEAGNFKVIIDGTEHSYPTRIRLYEGTLVASGEHTLKHDNEGNKSFSASAEAGINLIAVNCTGSGSWELPNIPRTSTLESVNVTNLENPFNLKVDKKSDAFTDNLTIKLGDVVIKEVTNYVSGTEINLTNDEILSVYNLQDGFTSTLKFTITTKNGDTTIGTSDIESEITSNGTIRLYKNGAFKSCIPMIYKNGTWKKCLCFISKGGTLKKGE